MPVGFKKTTNCIKEAHVKNPTFCPQNVTRNLNTVITLYDAMFCFQITVRVAKVHLISNQLFNGRSALPALPSTRVNSSVTV